MSKKMVSQTGFLDAAYDISHNNHETSKELKEKEKGLNKNNSLISKLLSKENTNYSKHGKGVSFLVKIKTILISLVNRYFFNRQMRVRREVTRLEGV